MPHPPLTDDVLNYIHRSVLCWLATVDADGFPNVAPKEVFAALDRNTLLIANIASPNSVRNIRTHSKVCVSFVDVFVQKGYKLRGTADLISPDDARFAKVAAPLESMINGMFRILGVMAIDVSAVEPIIAPSYKFVPGTTETSQIDGAMQAYGVSPILFGM